ncbi:MAG TPA: uracil-DNA glycosylase [Candidatus Dependentiae bacterium]|nr:uracil-DNA glycosylase [Candidatus Dependentiae bacterium]HRQ62977.1 uracil-DNA glycosylase [Candidatus Dependentiae bacterium]
MDAKKFKQNLLEELYEPYKKCLQCPLGNLGRTQVVFGHGNPDAELMFIGEGPGAEEDKQGLPFVGRSGQLLNRILQAVGLDREEVFITNIVKCRPPNNRKPLPTESETCKRILLKKQIQIIRPQVICTLGSAAIQGLLNDYGLKITQIRGKEFTYEDTRVIPTYHPAYILRNAKELQFLMQDIQTATNWLKQDQEVLT